MDKEKLQTIRQLVFGNKKYEAGFDLFEKENFQNSKILEFG